MFYNYEEPQEVRLLRLLAAVRDRDTDIERAVELIQGELLSSFSAGLSKRKAPRNTRRLPTRSSSYHS